jgi:hypothetical protein
VHGVKGTKPASTMRSTRKNESLWRAIKFGGASFTCRPRMLILNSSFVASKSAAHTKRGLTARRAHRILSQVIRLVDPRPTHFNERGIMQETAVRSNLEVTRESDDNDVVGGTDVIGTESFDDADVLVSDEVIAIENRDPEAVGGNDDDDKEDTVGGKDEGDEEDTVGGEDE